MIHQPIEVVIDRIVLHGFDGPTGRKLARSLPAELRDRLATLQPEAFAASRRVDRLDAGTAGDPSSGARGLAAEVARAVGSALNP